MKISYIIPRYNEPESVIKNALCSFNSQICNFNDFEVIIVDDCSNDKLSEDFLKSFDNLSIRYIFLENNVGPGLARQEGIDSSTADYIGFCDADDTLFDSLSVNTILSLTETKPDIIMTCGYEESGSDDEKILIHKGNDMIFMHGKALRRQFLIDNDIRFDESLRVHEDSNILSKCFSMTNNIATSQEHTYVWRNNKNSITRRNNASYTSDSLAEYVRAMGLSLDYIEAYSNEENLMLRLSGLVVYIYGMLYSKYFNKDYTDDVEGRISDVILKYRDIIEKCPYEYWIENMRMHADLIFNAQVFSGETLVQFINRMYQMKQEKNN